MEKAPVRKKRRLNPQITVQNRVAERRDPIAQPDLQLTNLSYRSDFPNKDVEMPSKEVLDLIHRVGTNLAKDHPEMYQTLLPSALLASDMKRAASNADDIRKHLHDDKKDLYAGEESDSDDSSDAESSSDENEDTSDSISSEMSNHN
jgi:hypothetical protein